MKRKWNHEQTNILLFRRTSYEKYLDGLQSKISNSFTKLNEYFMYEQISFPLKDEYEVADLEMIVSFLRSTIFNQNIRFLWAREEKNLVYLLTALID